MDFNTEKNQIAILAPKSTDFDMITAAPTSHRRTGTAQVSSRSGLVSAPVTEVKSADNRVLPCGNLISNPPSTVQK